ncbi:MAG: hypothetical protein ACPLZY_04885, partial [Candidatus Norongarragalinales archaeon]
NALAEASLIRGSAFIDEIVRATGLPQDDVKAVLEQFQREGKAYQPYPGSWKISEPPRRVGVKVVKWTGLTGKIDSWQAWKATEKLHWLHRSIPLDLEFPDGYKVEVRGPLTWFIARLKALDNFRKESGLTRDSTLPGCIGTGRPIPPNTCETCHHHGEAGCLNLADYKAKMAEFFREKTVKISRGLKYVDVNLYLCKTPYRLTPQGQKALWRLVFGYITSHHHVKRVYRQFFGITDDWASFTVMKKDVSKVVDEIVEILTTQGNIVPILKEVEK